MDPRPNVIVCMCDQLRAFEVGCYGNAVIRTPYIDRLAEQGVRFEHAVTNNPVCMPARSSLLSGQYSRTCMGSLGNYAVKDPQGGMTLPEYPVGARVHLPEPTLPERLKALGYDTALIGKWHVHPAPYVVGFDYSLYPRVHHRHTGQHFMENDGPEFAVDGYSVDWEADRVAAYLREHQQRPFFLFYNISPPHMPLLDAPEYYRRMYDPASIPLRPNVFDGGEPAYNERWFRIYLWDFMHYQQNLPHTQELPPGFDLRHLIALYYGATTWVDDMVGKLMANLEATGLAERTVVVFVSDHGDNLGSHQSFNKDLLFEESIRIPLIFHGPGLSAPQVNRSQVAQMIDIMPTLLELCGGETPDSVQGRSLMPILDGTSQVLDHNGAVIETSRGQIGLRTATHMYGAQLAQDLALVADDRYCFYDLTQDPYEQRNLARSEEQQELAASMRERLLAWHRTTPWMGA